MTVNRRQMFVGASAALIAGSNTVHAVRADASLQMLATDQPHCQSSEIPEELRSAVEAYNAASRAFMNGDPKLLQVGYSHCADVTILGGFGGYEHGWSEQVEKRLAWAAARFRGGVLTSENISLIAAPTLACNVGLEHLRVQLDGVEGIVDIDLRVTTVFRREDNQWKVVHRHADPLVKVQGSASIVRR
jgi:ketosteroid isomerase-like protein